MNVCKVCDQPYREFTCSKAKEALKGTCEACMDDCVSTMICMHNAEKKGEHFLTPDTGRMKRIMRFLRELGFVQPEVPQAVRMLPRGAALAFIVLRECQRVSVPVLSETAQPIWRDIEEFLGPESIAEWKRQAEQAGINDLFSDIGMSIIHRMYTLSRTA